MTCKVSLLPGKHAKGKSALLLRGQHINPVRFISHLTDDTFFQKLFQFFTCPVTSAIIQLGIIRFIDAFMLADIFQHLFLPGFDGFGRNICPFYFLRTFFFNHLLQTVGTAKIYPVDRNTKPDSSVFLGNFPGTQRRGEMPDPIQLDTISIAKLPAHIYGQCFQHTFYIGRINCTGIREISAYLFKTFCSSRNKTCMF